ADAVARAEVVDLAAPAPLEEGHVAGGDVAYVGEVAHRVRVADTHDRVLLPGLDQRELPRQRAAHEGRVLPGAGVVERPGADDVEAVGACPLRGRDVRRRLARAVHGHRTKRRLLDDGQLGGLHGAVDVARG